MPRARSIATALSAAALTLPSAALAQGQSGAGDDQYSDPLGGSGTSGQSSGGSSSAPASSSGGSSLSQSPNLGSSGSAPSASGSTAPAPTSASGAPLTSTAAGTLPNTGSDPRLLILAGLALLLSGLGLRLRTADEVF